MALAHFNQHRHSARPPSIASRARLSAITISTGVCGKPTTPSAATPKVKEWPSVNAVGVTTILGGGTRAIKPNHEEQVVKTMEDVIDANRQERPTPPGGVAVSISQAHNRASTAEHTRLAVPIQWPNVLENIR